MEQHIENGENTIYPKTNPQIRAEGRLGAIKSFVFILARQVGVFLIGIMVGMGLVLKNPPENMVMIKKVEILEKDKKALEKTLKDSVPVTRNSFVIE